MRGEGGDENTDTFRKVCKDRPFTVLDNGALRDPQLSLKARGMLCTCMSLPADWSFSVRGLAAICKEGREAVASALTELEKAGYLQRNKLQGRAEDGTFGGTEYVFFESPQPWPENPATDKPATGEPATVYPSTENPPQRNKEQEKKEQSPPIAPRRGRRGCRKEPEYAPELFARFWKAYPRGEDKQGAMREWDALRPDADLMRVMSGALQRQKATEEWQRGVGIPYACRWLKYRRWEDEFRSDVPDTNVGRTVETPEEVARW